MTRGGKQSREKIPGMYNFPLKKGKKKAARRKKLKPTGGTYWRVPKTRTGYTALKTGRARFWGVQPVFEQGLMWGKMNTKGGKSQGRREKLPECRERREEGVTSSYYSNWLKWLTDMGKKERWTIPVRRWGEIARWNQGCDTFNKKGRSKTKGEETELDRKRTSDRWTTAAVTFQLQTKTKKEKKESFLHAGNSSSFGYRSEGVKGHRLSRKKTNRESKKKSLNREAK